MENKIKIPIKAKIYYTDDARTSTKAYANVAIGDFMFINSVSIALGLYNNQLTVYPPNIKYLDKITKKVRYKKVLEFKSDSRLWDTITKVCLLAYARFESEGEKGVFGEPEYVTIDDIVDLSKTNTQDTLKPKSENNSRILY